MTILVCAKHARSCLGMTYCRGPNENMTILLCAKYVRRAMFGRSPYYRGLDRNMTILG